MTPRQIGGTLVVSGLVIAATAWMSQLPTLQAGPDEALIRLSWRMEGFAVEDCRTLSAEELARIPAHMRRPRECTRSIVDYELRVGIGSQDEVVDTVSPSGARRDRPVYVFRDVPVEPGRHDVQVTFTALVPAGVDEVEQPPPLRWADPIRLESNEIGLVTLDEAGARLVRRPPDP